MYRQGTVLYGNNVFKGNLWIITVDYSLHGSLLWNGPNKHFMPDPSSTDTMSINMSICNDPYKHTGQTELPKWAKDLVIAASPVARTGSIPVVLPKSSITLDPAVIKSISAALNLEIGNKEVDFKTIASYSKDGSEINECKDGRVYHDWCNYTGLIEQYQYCSYCDMKRKG